GVLGATVTGRIVSQSRWPLAILVALALVASMLVALGSVPTLPPALVAALAAGGGLVVGEVLSETALPRMLGDEGLARAYGLVLPLSLGGIVAGSLVAGPLVGLLGITGALTLCGAIVFGATGWFARHSLQRRVRVIARHRPQVNSRSASA